MRNTINSGRKFCYVGCAVILACAGSGQLWGVAGLPGRTRAKDLKLTLVAYDYAHVSGPTLADAEPKHKESSRHYSEIIVSIERRRVCPPGEVKHSGNGKEDGAGQKRTPHIGKNLFPVPVN